MKDNRLYIDRNLFKELAHEIMEVERSQDPQLASRKSRRTNDKVVVQVQRLQIRGVDGVSSSPSLSLKAEVPAQTRGLREGIPFRPSVDWMKRTHPLGWAIYVT